MLGKEFIATINSPSGPKVFKRVVIGEHYDIYKFSEKVNQELSFRSDAPANFIHLEDSTAIEDSRENINSKAQEWIDSSGGSFFVTTNDEEKDAMRMLNDLLLTFERINK